MAQPVAVKSLPFIPSLTVLRRAGPFGRYKGMWRLKSSYWIIKNSLLSSKVTIKANARRPLQQSLTSIVTAF